MRAAVLRGEGLFVVEEVPQPKAGPGEVVAKVVVCGICGSDVHSAILDGAPLAGTILGHEWSGFLVEVGEGVEDWKPGDRVVAGPAPPCGKCPKCLQGYPDICDYQLSTELPSKWRPGAFAEYVAVKASRLFRIPNEMTFEEAATIEPLAVSLHIIRESGMRPGDSVVVLGGGPIGLGALQFAKINGARLILLTEVLESRARLAKRLGADEVLDPLQMDIGFEVTQRLPLGADVVIQATGVGSTIQQAVDLVRPHGHVVLAGVIMEEIPIFPLPWLLKEVSLKGCYSYTREDYHLTIELLRLHRIDGSSMVSDIVPLDDLPGAFTELMHPTSQIKVLVRP